MFGYSVFISGNTAVVGAGSDDIERFNNSGYGYVYTKTGRKLIDNFKIVPEYGAAYDYFGFSVDLLGVTGMFGTPGAG